MGEEEVEGFSRPAEGGDTPGVSPFESRLEYLGAFSAAEGRRCSLDWSLLEPKSIFRLGA